jgi:flagellar hook-basal body complex protein FliE
MESISGNLTANLLSTQGRGNPLSKALGGDSDAPGGSSDEAGNILNSFGGMLKNEIAKISELKADADQKVQTYAVGGEVELHNVLIAMEKADTSMQLAVQVRNKLVNAYQELTRMQI